MIHKLIRCWAYCHKTPPRSRAAAKGALEAARSAGCLLEVNTGGVFRGYRDDFYPSGWLLEAWAGMGGKVIITADAHSVDGLTFGRSEERRVGKESRCRLRQ